MNDFLDCGSAGGDDRSSVGITSGVGTRSIGWGGDDGGGLVETMISEAGEAMVVEQRRTISLRYLQFAAEKNQPKPIPGRPTLVSSSIKRITPVWQLFIHIGSESSEVH